MHSHGGWLSIMYSQLVGCLVCVPISVVFLVFMHMLLGCPSSVVNISQCLRPTTHNCVHYIVHEQLFAVWPKAVVLAYQGAREATNYCMPLIVREASFSEAEKGRTLQQTVMSSCCCSSQIYDKAYHVVGQKKLFLKDTISLYVKFC